jgi:hypothetical protein
MPPLILRKFLKMTHTLPGWSQFVFARAFAGDLRLNAVSKGLRINKISFTWEMSPFELGELLCFSPWTGQPSGAKRQSLSPLLG